MGMNVGIHISWVISLLADHGIDTEDENFKQTPKRWLQYLAHYCQDYNPKKDLGVTFSPAVMTPDGGDTYDVGMVVQRGIPYRAVCAHHLLPVLGTAHVGYIPRGKQVGLSKLTRLVYGISHTLPSLQEDVCNAVTFAIMKYLEPQGAMCVIKATHGCMEARGVEEAPGCIETVTSSVQGVFAEKPEARSEFFSLVGMS